MILVFLKTDGEGQDEAKDEALIFAYTVHEFGAGEETTPKSKWTVLGYKMCQFWCAAPGDDYYLFNDPMLNGWTRTSRNLPFGWRILVETNRGNFEGTSNWCKKSARTAIPFSSSSIDDSTPIIPYPQ
ncbi:unnamed protein product [Caenorhabditis nigoni]